MKELGINTAGSARSIPYTDSFDEILKTHENFINSVVLKCARTKSSISVLDSKAT